MQYNACFFIILFSDNYVEFDNKLSMEIFYYFKLYLIINGIIMIGYYLISSGLAYVLFYKVRREKWKKMRIQERYPKSKSIRREIKWSVITVFILGALTTVLYYF